jgi:hypothetical protein
LETERGLNTAKIGERGSLTGSGCALLLHLEHLEMITIPRAKPAFQTAGICKQTTPPVCLL